MTSDETWLPRGGVNRRHVIVGLSANAAPFVLSSRPQAASACIPTAGTACRIIDASTDLTRVAKRIADIGITTVGRFYTRLANFDHGAYQNTALSTDELKALED